MARYVHPHFKREANTLHVASYDNATAKHATAGAESQKAVESEIERYQQAQGQANGQPTAPGEPLVKGQVTAGGRAW